MTMSNVKANTDYHDNTIMMTSSSIQKIIDKYSVNPGNENQLDLIVDSLWLGNEQAIANHKLLEEKQITDVINISDSIIKPSENINYYGYLMIDKWACSTTDNDDDNDNDNSNVAYDTLIEECAQMIDYLIKNNRRVVIYCKRGHHRSASVVAYYLVNCHNYKLPDAVMKIKSIRPTALRRMSCMLKSIIVMCS
jgi:protein tyrosine/serine phosphatase